MKNCRVILSMVLLVCTSISCKKDAFVTPPTQFAASLRTSLPIVVTHNITITARTHNLPPGWYNINNLSATISATYNMHHNTDTIFVADTTDYIYGRLYLKGINGNTDDRIPIVFKRWSMAFGGSTSALFIGNSSYFNLQVPAGQGYKHGDYLYLNGRKNLSTGQSHGGVQIHQCHHAEISGLWVDNVNGFGMQVKTDMDGADKIHTEFPWFIQDSITIRNCKATNTDNEGFYFGHTGVQSNKNFAPGDKPSPLRDLIVDNLYTQNTGWDGIQFTGVIRLKGSNLQIINPATKKEPSQSTGLPVQNNVSGSIDNVLIQQPTKAAIILFTSGYFKLSNVTVNLASDNTSSIFIDNRPILYGDSTQHIDMLNINIKSIQNNSNKLKTAIVDLNGIAQSGSIKAKPGLWSNVSIVSGFTMGNISDAAHNSYCGGSLARGIACPVH